MKLHIILFLLLFLNSGVTTPALHNALMKATRVQEAFAEKGKMVDKTLAEHAISRDSVRIYLRAFKTSKLVELWAKNISDSVYVPVKTFPICEISGSLGPKRRSRDLQVPEGFYHISDINPYSKYYLSMQINYPNLSDSIRGVHGHLGNLIFIHGDCISSGCIAITNDRIKELVVYCMKAYQCGQKEIELTIYPAKLDASVYSALTAKYKTDKDKLSLWADLRKSYDLFELKKRPASIHFRADGTHEIQ